MEAYDKKRLQSFLLLLTLLLLLLLLLLCSMLVDMLVQWRSLMLARRCQSGGSRAGPLIPTKAAKRNKKSECSPTRLNTVKAFVPIAIVLSNLIRLNR